MARGEEGEEAGQVRCVQENAGPAAVAEEAELVGRWRMMKWEAAAAAGDDDGGEGEEAGERLLWEGEEVGAGPPKFLVWREVGEAELTQVL